MITAKFNYVIASAKLMSRVNDKELVDNMAKHLSTEELDYLSDLLGLMGALNDLVRKQDDEIKRLEGIINQQKI